MLPFTLLIFSSKLYCKIVTNKKDQFYANIKSACLVKLQTYMCVTVVFEDQMYDNRLISSKQSFEKLTLPFLRYQEGILFSYLNH